MDDAVRSFASFSLASVDPGISIYVPITNKTNLKKKQLDLNGGLKLPEYSPTQEQ